MVDLSTQYLGMTLKNPVIAGSCGLTNSVKSIKELEESGAGAVVLKSIFEEEIAFEYDDILNEAESKGYDLDQFDYYDYKIKEDNLSRYTALINDSKKSVIQSIEPNLIGDPVDGFGKGLLIPSHNVSAAQLIRIHLIPAGDEHHRKFHVPAQFQRSPDHHLRHGANSQKS